jgi:hypothetical protein
MIDSTPLPVVVDQSPAGTTQSVVEADAGGQTEKALQYALFETSQGTSSVAFQSEDVLAGVEDGFDALPKRSNMWTFPGLVFSLGPDHDSLQVFGGRSELSARISLVAEQDLPARSPAAVEELKSNISFIAFGRGDLKGPGSAVGGEDSVQTHSPEIAGVAGAIAVVTDVGKGGTQSRLPASSTFNRGGVDEQKVVRETGALLSKDDQEPAEIGGETASALEVAGLSGNTREQVGKRLARPAKETPVRGLAHDGLGDCQGNNLSVGDAPAGITPSFWQKIIGCAINKGAEGVEVGVHRGLRADGVFDTVDFGLSASNPFCTVIFVESII